MPPRKRKIAKQPDVYEPRIHPNLLPYAVPCDSLKQYYLNPNQGDVGVIRDSLRRNGQYKPITVNIGTHTGRPNEILAGNHTWSAALELEWPDIAASFVDVDEYAARRIVAVDNESAAKAKRDKQALHDLMLPIADDLAGTGITPDEFSKLIGPAGPADDESDMQDEQRYAVIIDCTDEEHQLRLLETFEAEGLNARALVQ